MKSFYFSPPPDSQGGWRRAASAALGFALMALLPAASLAENAADAGPPSPQPAIDSFHYERAKAAAAPGEEVVATSRPRILAVFKPSTAPEGAPVMAPEVPEGALGGASASVLFLDATGQPAVARPANWRDQLGLEASVDYPAWTYRPEIQYQAVPNPSGGEMVTVDRSFHPYLVGQVNGEGALIMSCRRASAPVAAAPAQTAKPAGERSPMANLAAKRQADTKGAAQ